MPKPLQLSEVSFKTSDGGHIVANLYGQGEHGVVLAHGAVFNKESWHDQAQFLVKSGYQVLAIDFRGYGQSVGGKEDAALHEDVLGAVRYLHTQGSRQVSVIGGSMGGGAAARAATRARPGEIDRLILLAHVPIQNPQAMIANKRFFIVGRGDRLLASCKDQYERAAKPKRLTVLEGRAHAQHIFKTDQAETLMQRISEFLSEEIHPE